MKGSEFIKWIQLFYDMHLNDRKYIALELPKDNLNCSTITILNLGRLNNGQSHRNYVVLLSEKKLNLTFEKANNQFVIVKAFTLNVKLYIVLYYTLYYIIRKLFEWIIFIRFILVRMKMNKTFLILLYTLRRKFNLCWFVKFISLFSKF